MLELKLATYHRAAEVSTVCHPWCMGN